MMAITYDVYTMPRIATNQTFHVAEKRPSGGLTKALERMKTSWCAARHSGNAIYHLLIHYEGLELFPQLEAGAEVLQKRVYL